MAGLPLPKQVYVETTSRCNMECPICIRTYHLHEKPRDMTFDEFKSLTDQFPELHRVALHGTGEPLLNKAILPMVACAKSRGAYVLFNSNATLLDEELGQGICESGLDEFRVSIDAVSPSMYRVMRGAPLFDAVIENVRTLVRSKKRLGLGVPKVSLWFVGTAQNIIELPELIRLAAGLEVREVYLQRFMYFLAPDEPGFAKEELSIHQSSDDNVLDIISESEHLARNLQVSLNASGATTPLDSLTHSPQAASPWSTCRRPWSGSFITAAGNVLPCCLSPTTIVNYEEFVLGNIFQKSFSEIWNGPKYTAFRQRIKSVDPPESCGGCGVRWSL